MIAPVPDVEAREWFHELDELDDAWLEQERGSDVGLDARLHGEGDMQGPDDDAGRAAEDLDAASASA